MVQVKVYFCDDVFVIFSFIPQNSHFRKRSLRLAGQCQPSKAQKKLTTFYVTWQILEAHRKNDIMIYIGEYPVEIKTSSYREDTNLQSNLFCLKIIFSLKSIPHLKSVTRMQPSYPMHDVTLVSPLPHIFGRY